MKYRRQLGLGLLCLLLPGVVFVWHRRINPPDYGGIASCGGETLMAAGFPAQPYYLQVDPAWSRETIGGSGEPMGNVGCTVCCLSMAFTQLGFPMDPKTLNAELKSHDGYTRSGWLKWDVAAQIANGTIAIELPKDPSHAAIDAAIRSGNPVVARIRLWETYQHWVLIVGKDGTDYLVKDPLCRAERIEKLSALSSKILAIRIVKKTANQGSGGTPSAVRLQRVDGNRLQSENLTDVPLDLLGTDAIAWMGTVKLTGRGAAVIQLVKPTASLPVDIRNWHIFSTETLLTSLAVK